MKVVAIFGLISSVQAWVSHTASRTTTTTTTTTTSLQATSTRQEFMQTLVNGAAAVGVAAATSSVPLPALAEGSVSLPNGVSYVVKKNGSGPQPEIGELVAIRFSASVNGNELDNIFDTPEPYYTRLGSGGLLKGVEETLPLMKLGDRWVLTIPSNLAFGKQGRPASPGKPRIPGDASVEFEVEMVSLPGKEPELIDIIGDY